MEARLTVDGREVPLGAHAVVRFVDEDGGPRPVLYLFGGDVWHPWELTLVCSSGPGKRGPAGGGDRAQDAFFAKLADPFTPAAEAVAAGWKTFLEG